MLEGTLLLAEERPQKALELFQRVEAESGDQPMLRLRLANAYFQLHKFEKSMELLDRVLEIDPEEVGAWFLNGACHFHVGEYDDAIECLLNAIGLQYYQPVAHHYLAESLYSLGRFEEAATAYEVCLRIAPTMNKARLRLISICENQLGDHAKAERLRDEMRGKYKGEMVIVSGLPRSGTSMMMQMLAGGGLPIFTDDERKADANNEKGYYEHEAVKNLAANKSWLPDASGKGVKVIAQLIRHLPLNYRYKVIFMARELTEVISSQNKMLARLGKPETAADGDQLTGRYEKSVTEVLDWMASHSNFEVITVDYDEAIANPLVVARRIREFIGNELDEVAMAAAVDANLRRERATPRF
jgi:tetratricopeptide (TPR) repeat protein